MNEPIRGSVELTEADCVDAYLGCAAHKKSIRSLRKNIAILLGVTLVVVAMARPTTPGVWTASVLLLVAGLFVVRQQWVWIAKRSFAFLPEARRRFEVTFTDEGVRAKGSRAEVSYSWSAIVDWVETASMLVLLGPHGVSDFVPKRAFDEDQLAALRGLFAEKIVPEPTVASASLEPPKGRSWVTFALWVVLVLVFVAILQLVTRWT